MAALLSIPAQLPGQKGTLERVSVHGDSLEGNLSGDSPDRDVSIYLPPSYRADAGRRYPALYMLHGFTDSDEQWMGLEEHWINLTKLLDEEFGGGAKEMIVVMPNAFTRFHGSMYSASVTTGDWEGFIAEELVAFVDARFKTIARREARGLAGHSMGGYGALRIGMKRPEVFSSVYLLSPCCLSPRRGGPPGNGGGSPAEAIDSMEEFASASFGVKALFASAAAWAPNPANPPFYLDLPYRGGEPRPEILAKFAANAPLATLDQYVFNLRRLEALGFDAGDQDRGIAAAVRELDERLTRYEIPHEFEIYEGDHTNRVDERIRRKTLPFFGENLEFE